jgi:hypothetical protein
LFRCCIESFRPADALLRVRKKFAGTMAGGVQLCHGLIEVHPDPPDQADRADELPERLAERLIRRGPHPPGDRQRRLGRVCAPGQPGPSCGSAKFAELLVTQGKLHPVGPPAGLA